MSHTIFTAMVEKKYKQAYKQHFDKLFPLYQSKQIELEGVNYHVVSQMRMKDYPLFSDFDVLDEMGVSTDDTIGRRIHHFIARLTLTKLMLYKVKVPLAKLATENIQSESIRNEFHIEDDEEITQLTQSVLTMLNAINDLIGLTEKLLEKEHWDDSNIQALEDLWHAFISTYETRANVLQKLYVQQSKHVKGESPYQSQLAKLLWQEAQIVYKTYQLLTPLGADTGRFSLDGLIDHNYECARHRQSDEPLEKKHKMERGLYGFTLAFYRLFVWLFIPFLIFALWLDKSLTFATLLSIAIFCVVGFLIKTQNKRHLLGKVHTDRAERYAISFQDETTEKREEKKDVSIPKTKDSPSVLYETDGILIHLFYVFLFVVIGYLAVIVYSFIDGVIDVQWLCYLSLVGIAFAIFTLFPFKVLIRKRLVIIETAIHIGGRKFGAPEVERIRITQDGKVIHIFISSSDSPFRLRVPEGNNASFKRALKKFCEKYHIPIVQQIKKQ